MPCDPNGEHQAATGNGSYTGLAGPSSPEAWSPAQAHTELMSGTSGPPKRMLGRRLWSAAPRFFCGTPRGLPHQASHNSMGLSAPAAVAH